MELDIRSMEKEDLSALTALWNAITEAGQFFPGEAPLSLSEAKQFFGEQTDTVCALSRGELIGFYILHPNNVGRCAHIANASYGVDASQRGKGFGKILVQHSLKNAKSHGFHGLQYNAVVANNHSAIRLYEQLGFRKIGTIPGGYRLKDGSFIDIYIYFYQL